VRSLAVIGAVYNGVERVRSLGRHSSTGFLRLKGTHMRRAPIPSPSCLISGEPLLLTDTMETYRPRFSMMRTVSNGGQKHRVTLQEFGYCAPAKFEQQLSTKGAQA
jgi:hypothetical protein